MVVYKDRNILVYNDDGASYYTETWYYCNRCAPEFKIISEIDK